MYLLWTAGSQILASYLHIHKAVKQLRESFSFVILFKVLGLANVQFMQLLSSCHFLLLWVVIALQDSPETTQQLDHRFLYLHLSIPKMLGS